MFEVTKKEYVNKSFRLNKKLLNELQTQAAINHVSLNELVVQCCTYALNDSNYLHFEASEK